MNIRFLIQLALAAGLIGFVGIIAVRGVDRGAEPAVSRSRSNVLPQPKGNVGQEEAEPLVRTFVSPVDDGPFAPRTWQPPQPPLAAPIAVSQVVPAASSAPPLPFQFAGKVDLGDGKVMLYLSKGNESFSLSAGDKFDSDYRLVGIENGKVAIEYLPLEVKQYLPVSAE